jgi:flagellar biosynthesis/type III secretory pathway protein FliH
LKAQIGQTITYYNRALGEARAMIDGDEPTAASPITGVADDGEASAEDELLYDWVHSTGHKHGFSEGYDDGTNAALEALGRLDLVDTDVDEARIDEVASDVEEMSTLIPADEVDAYEHIYEQAKDEGYDEGFEAGYENVTSQFGGPPEEGG